MTRYQKDAPGSQLSFGKIGIDLAVMVCELWPFKGDAKWPKNASRPFQSVLARSIMDQASRVRYQGMRAVVSFRLV